MEDFVQTSLYLRLSIEIWLIALSIYSMRTIFRSVPLFGHGLLLAMVSLFVTTAVTYFTHTEFSRVLTASELTPALGIFGILWVVALVRYNGRTDSERREK